jgi:hypothetical protein
VYVRAMLATVTIWNPGAISKSSITDSLNATTYSNFNKVVATIKGSYVNGYYAIWNNNFAQLFAA